MGNCQWRNVLLTIKYNDDVFWSWSQLATVCRKSASHVWSWCGQDKSNAIASLIQPLYCYSRFLVCILQWSSILPFIYFRRRRWTFCDEDSATAESSLIGGLVVPGIDGWALKVTVIHLVTFHSKTFVKTSVAYWCCLSCTGSMLAPCLVNGAKLRNGFNSLLRSCFLNSC